jgi:hypothetical protein
MGLMNVAIAIYLLIYLAILLIICAIGYNKNYKGKSEKEIEEMLSSTETKAADT